MRDHSRNASKKVLEGGGEDPPHANTNLYYTNTNTNTCTNTKDNYARPLDVRRC